MIISYNKTEIKEYKPESSLDVLIDLVSKSLTPEEYDKTEFSKMKLQGNGSSDWHRFFNSTLDPITWLSIYKYDKLYGSNWTTTPKSMNLISGGNVLDFGAGSGTPWVDIPDTIHLYLLEANLVLFDRLVANYSNNKNVTVINSFYDIKSLKFDYVYSKDVLEHVRYVNEHLDILYYLGNEQCSYYLDIDTASAGTHVLNLHLDTTINDFWVKLT